MHIEKYPIEINEFPYRLTATVRVISEETICVFQWQKLQKTYISKSVEMYSRSGIWWQLFWFLI